MFLLALPSRWNGRILIMGSSLREELERELDRVDIIAKTTDAIMDRLVPKPSDPCENMTPKERETHERAMALCDLDSAFERLGLHDKLEDIKPDIERCKMLVVDGWEGWRAKDLDSLKRVIEFIECLDEP